MPCHRLAAEGSRMCVCARVHRARTFLRLFALRGAGEPREESAAPPEGPRVAWPCAQLGERGHVFGKRSWRCPGASHGPGASPPPHEEHLPQRVPSRCWESPHPQANSRAEGGWCRRIYLRTEAKLNLFVFFLKEKLSPEEPRCKCSRWELSRLFFQICSHVATCPEQNRNRIAAQATPYLFI